MLVQRCVKNMATLENRKDLLERTVEALTSPDFIALTTLSAGNQSRYLSLEAEINDARQPIKAVFTQNKQRNFLEYTLIIGQQEYKGHVSISEAKDADDKEIFRANIALTTINQKPALTREVKHKVEIGYRKDNQFVALTRDELGNINYWIPTIINRIALNPDNFLRGLKDIGSMPDHADDNNNKYTLDTEGLIKGPILSAHFRRSYVRQLKGNAGEPLMRLSVSGTFVNTDWRSHTLTSICDVIKEHRSEIFNHHFYNELLPSINNAGHNTALVRESYER